VVVSGKSFPSYGPLEGVDQLFPDRCDWLGNTGDRVGYLAIRDETIVTQDCDVLGDL
jgi:hypothetical protein